MKRVLATLVCDFHLQWRNGFYAVTAFVVVFWGVMSTQVSSAGLAWMAPAIVAGNLVVNTFYYIAGLVLLEKGEGTLEAQVVTPLRAGEYLLSKLVSLLLLSLAENLLIVTLWVGFGYRLLPLALGILLASALFVLAGFILVARYDSINAFLMPSVAVTALLLVPLLDGFRLASGPLFYLHPLQAALALMRAGLLPVSAAEMAYGLLYSAAWVGLAFVLGRRAFYRFVVASPGA